MNDFLTFKTFISADVLIFFYYVGAVVIPILIWQSRRYLIENFKIMKQINKAFMKVFSSFDAKEQTYIKVFAVFMFLFMEMVWRMMFEAMIAYFDMRDCLQQMAG